MTGYVEDPSVTIYRHRTSGAYRVQAMGLNDQQMLGEYGIPVIIAPERVRQEIAQAVGRCLRAFGMERTPVKYSKSDYDAFRAKHDAVFLSQLESGDLELVPSRHVAGGYRGMNRDAIVLPSPYDDDQLCEAIEKAFDVAC